MVHWMLQFLEKYSKVSNRRGVWTSRDDWKKNKKLIVGRGGIVGALVKNLKVLIAGEGYSKSKIKTKVKSK